MRSLDRIESFTKEINEIWSRYQDMRFGQMISNFQDWYGHDIYYIEDSEFIKKFREYMNGNYN